MNGVTASRKRVAILISGRGSNMSALITAAGDPAYPGEIVGVLSDRTDAEGLTTAARCGIAAKAIDRAAYADRTAHEAVIAQQLEEWRADVVCLAGYMRLLSGDFVRRFKGRIINIHPSLLPLFPGLDTHARALAAGMKVHGCTVHFVTDRMDEGPIIAQAAIAIEADDTTETLAERLLRAEHKLYPHALRLVLAGDIRMADGRAITAPAGPVAEGDPACVMDGPPMLVSPNARRN